jgi:1,4-dihydroxy-2-naphthoyl-CoA hydrolase
MFTHETTVRLYDTDGAGLLFFGNHFRIAHAVYEAYLESQGIGIGEVIRNKEYLAPLVRAEADYLEPLGVSDRLTIQMSCINISEHSFILNFVFLKDGVLEAARVRTVHVCTDGTATNKRPLPEQLVAALEGIRE